MSKNPFVNQLGDALEAAFVAEKARKPTSRYGLSRRRRMLLVAFALVAIGCGVAVATTLLGSTTLALQPVQCVAGATLDDPVVSSPENSTRSPASLCAHDLGLPASKLVACARERDGFVFVFHANGAHQCTRLGLEPLPASYPAAQRKVQRLVRALGALEGSAYCLSPARFTAGATRILHRLGFTGWRVFASNTPADEVGLIGGGPCAVLDGAAYPRFRPAIRLDALDSSSKTVSYSLGPPPALTKLVGTLAVAIERRTASRCFSRPGLEAYAAELLASHHLGTAFAYRAQTPGESLDQGPTLGYGGQRRYEHGCPVVMLARTAAGNLRVVDLLVNQRGAAPMPDHGLPPQSAFSRRS